MGTRWRTWSLSRSDGRPREDELCVVRKISRQTGAPVYSAGYLRRDPRDPTSRKLWWHRDGALARRGPRPMGQTLARDRLDGHLTACGGR